MLGPSFSGSRFPGSRLPVSGPLDSPFDPRSYAFGRTLKKWNALTALLCGGVPAVVLAHYVWNPAAMAVGVVVGLLWSNFFEYAYHRWILHWPETDAFERHALHHSSVGRPNEPEHLPLGGSPKLVAMLFLINGAPVFLFDLWLRVGFASGIFIGFAIYTILSEDIHWRFHMNEWVPWFLEPARSHHLLHHDRPRGNYSVFLPLFDKLFGTWS